MREKVCWTSPVPGVHSKFEWRPQAGPPYGAPSDSKPPPGPRRVSALGIYQAPGPRDGASQGWAALPQPGRLCWLLPGTWVRCSCSPQGWARDPLLSSAGSGVELIVSSGDGRYCVFVPLVLTRLRPTFQRSFTPPMPARVQQAGRSVWPDRKVAPRPVRKVAPRPNHSLAVDPGCARIRTLFAVLIFVRVRVHRSVGIHGQAGSASGKLFARAGFPSLSEMGFERKCVGSLPGSDPPLCEDPIRGLLETVLAGLRGADDLVEWPPIVSSHRKYRNGLGPMWRCTGSASVLAGC